jgi:hypothetical protein
MRAQEVQEANDLFEAAIACHQEFLSFDLSYRTKLERWLGSAYGIAYRLYRNGTAWRKFTEADLWKGRRKRPRGSQKHMEKALIWTMRFMLSNGKNDQYNRAYVYAHGLKQFFDEGVKPEEIPGLLKKHGGIEALYRKYVKKVQTDKERRVSDRSFLADLGEGPTSEQESKSQAKSKPKTISIVPDSTGQDSNQPSSPIDAEARRVLYALDRLQEAVVAHLQRRALGIAA